MFRSPRDALEEELDVAEREGTEDVTEGAEEVRTAGTLFSGSTRSADGVAGSACFSVDEAEEEEDVEELFASTGAGIFAEEAVEDDDDILNLDLTVVSLFPCNSGESQV